MQHVGLNLKLEELYLYFQVAKSCYCSFFQQLFGFLVSVSRSKKIGFRYLIPGQTEPFCCLSSCF